MDTKIRENLVQVVKFQGYPLTVQHVSDLTMNARCQCIMSDIHSFYYILVFLFFVFLITCRGVITPWTSVVLWDKNNFNKVHSLAFSRAFSLISWFLRPQEKQKEVVAESSTNSL